MKKRREPERPKRTLRGREATRLTAQTGGPGAEVVVVLLCGCGTVVCSTCDSQNVWKKVYQYQYVVLIVDWHPNNGARHVQCGILAVLLPPCIY